MLVRATRLLLVFPTLLALAGPAPAADPTPQQLRQLAELLRDPAMQEWLTRQADESAPVSAATIQPGGTVERPSTALPAAATDVPRAAALAQAGPTMQADVNDRLARTRHFLHGVAAAAPRLPQELASAARRFATEAGDRGPLFVVFLLAAFLTLGIGTERLFWRASKAVRTRMIALPVETVEQRVRAALLRTVYGLLVLLAFAVGSAGAFLLFPWPPLVAEIVLGYLSAILLVRLVLVFGRIILAPGAPRFRLVPMTTDAARFWFVWSAILVGFFRTVQVTLDALSQLSVSQPAVDLIGLLLGLVLVGLTLYVVWRHPPANGSLSTGRGQRLGAWLLSIAVVSIWLVLLSGSVAPFFVGVVLLLAPIALRGVRAIVRQIARPPADAAGTSAEASPSLTAVIVERIGRALILIAAAYFIASQAGVDFDAMASNDTLGARVVRGAVDAFSILLLADLAWHLARAWIDRRLAQAIAFGAPKDDGLHSAAVALDTPEGRRMARMRTLLPMLRNVILIVVLLVAGLMVLSSLGVDVGPLIAGAGVLGLAVGFGAQTLVKDIISGVFFLLDDAFRVGEYIESGSIRGTVESFSLRSIMLRHHRGMLHTIPFGSIEKVTNYSRDYAIDKMTISVTYDTDLEKARKLVKEIGRELAANPAYGPLIIEPLKMQGVETFGDYAIQIRLKMVTRPGEQFVIRRKAYAMIKTAFDAHGIEFAFPTVKVSGGDANAAGSQTLIDRGKPSAEVAPA